MRITGARGLPKKQSRLTNHQTVVLCSIIQMLSDSKYLFENFQMLSDSEYLFENIDFDTSVTQM